MGVHALSVWMDLLKSSGCVTSACWLWLAKILLLTLTANEYGLRFEESSNLSSRRCWITYSKVPAVCM